MKKALEKFSVLVLLFGISIYSQNSFAQATVVTYTSSGTFSVPTGVTSITIESWGGGGKGGTRTSNGVSGGGGGGAYAKHVLSVTSGSNYTVTVGAGSSSTSAGGDSWFGSTSTTIAKGGNSVTNDQNNGANGGASGSSIGNAGVFSGGNGASGSSNNYGGGGGSSAGTAANGANGSGSSANGGTAPTGGGNGGSGKSGNTTGSGVAGTIPGGGGGGALRNGSGTSNGGNGANGKVVVTYTVAEITVFSSYGANVLNTDNTPTTDKGTDFGSQLVVGGSITSEFSIVNTGTGALTLGTPTFTGATGDYSVVSIPTSVAAGSSGTLIIKFDPTTTGTRNAVISISNNDSDENPYTFSLTGIGTAPEINLQGGPAPTSIAHNDITPSTTDGTDFGSQSLAGSVTRTFVIQNTGTGLLTVGNITFTGTNASEFSVTANPASTVPAGGSTTFAVTFDPTGSGSKSATINIVNSDSDENPYKFALSGSVQGSLTLIGDIYVASASPVAEIPMYSQASSTYGTDFGSVNTVGSTVVKTFSLKNDSGIITNTLTGISITLTGTGFSLTGSPAILLGAGGTTTFSVTFDPSAAGVANGTITVNSSDPNEGSYKFYITGTGTNPEISVYGGNPLASMSDNAAASTTNGTNFGSQYISTSYIIRTYTITNTGDGALTIGTITNSNTTDFTVSAISSPIPVGGSTTFTIKFDPTSAGAKSALISIVTNDTDENPFRINLSGTAVAGNAPQEINVKGGSSPVDININDAASTAKGTDFGGIYVINGSISNVYTIQNLGTSTMSTGTITFSGTAATDFSVSPANPGNILSGGSVNITVTFNPTIVGTRTATISIPNNDSNESPYTFYLEGTGNTYLDSDADGVTDDSDLDDDNDGILDTLEQSACNAVPRSTTAGVIFLNETFGTGTSNTTISNNISTSSTTYTYQDGSGDMNDGQYTVKNSAQITSWAADYWYTGPDHTGDTNGKMALFNATDNAGLFYKTTITGLTPNIDVTYSFYAINLDRTDAPSVATRYRPNIKVEIRKVSDNSLITSISTGNLSPCPVSGTASDWGSYSATFNTSETAIKVIFINNAPGGIGNDIALDDIKITQQYCDLDGDGDADVFDLDDDNDGIPDVVEGGFKAYSNHKSIIDITDTALWKDANENGLNDYIDPAYISNYYTAYVPDSDSDGIYDFMDLDSDNDSIFDIDEGQKDSYYVSNSLASYNGDGDVDGNGTGDGIDADSDGIKDLNDDNTSKVGTTNKAYPTDTDGDGKPDYLDITSNGSTYDIAATLYKDLDANNNGIIDGTSDIDKDGIIDAFDSDTSNTGSPRNITNLKLLIDFDGRNDYAEGAKLLGGLSNASIMGWIKLDANFSGTGIVLGQDNFYLSVDGTTKKVTATAGSYTATLGTALVVSRWYHIAATYSSSSSLLKLYVNGTLVSPTTAVSGSLAASVNKFTIARKSGAATNYFRGYIDEVRVFNTALTDDQVQKMVYQEIQQSGSLIQGSVIAKDIESTTWASLIAYYRMDDYKNDVIDNYIIAGTDDSPTDDSFARIYNVKYLKTQNAPLPFTTIQSGALNSTALTDATNFIYGPDITANNYSIIQVKHNATISTNFTGLGLIVDSNKTLTVDNNNKVENSWYLNLNGKIDLQGKSQLVQGLNSELAVTSAGSIERDQQGTKNIYNYNYLSSPVSTISNSANNLGYTLSGVLRDGTNANSPQSITWTSSYDGSATSPITLSISWIYKFQNLSSAYANWAYVGQNGSLSAGQGFTLKGSGASTATQNYTFIGKPNNGTITNPIAAGNLNLSGNPYPSAIDADAFIKDNIIGGNAGTSASILGTLYFWEHSSTNNTHNLANYQGGYAYRNLVSGVPPVAVAGINGVGSSSKTPGRYIPVGQAFFVEGNASGGNITFKNSQRIFVKEDDANSNTIFRSANTTVQANDNSNDAVASEDLFKKVRIGFNSHDNFHRQILIGFMNENANDELNPGYDAENFDDNPSDMSFLNSEKKLVIQGVGAFAQSNIYPLSVKTDASGTIQFVLDGTENMEDSQDIYIFDSVLNQYHDIRAGIFEIAMDPGTYNERFSLTFANETLGTNNPETPDAVTIVYTNNNNLLTIKNNTPDNIIKSAMLFNMLGQQIANWDVENENQSEIRIPVSGVSTGTYIVKITSDKGNFTKKVIIK